MRRCPNCGSELSGSSACRTCAERGNAKALTTSTRSGSRPSERRTRAGAANGGGGRPIQGGSNQVVTATIIGVAVLVGILVLGVIVLRQRPHPGPTADAPSDQSEADDVRRADEAKRQAELEQRAAEQRRRDADGSRDPARPEPRSTPRVEPSNRPSNRPPVTNRPPVVDPDAEQPEDHAPPAPGPKSAPKPAVDALAAARTAAAAIDTQIQAQDWAGAHAALTKWLTDFAKQVPARTAQSANELARYLALRAECTTPISSDAIWLKINFANRGFIEAKINPKRLERERNFILRTATGILTAFDRDQLGDPAYQVFNAKESAALDLKAFLSDRDRNVRTRTKSQARVALARAAFAKAEDTYQKAKTTRTSAIGRYESNEKALANARQMGQVDPEHYRNLEKLRQLAMDADAKFGSAEAEYNRAKAEVDAAKAAYEAEIEGVLTRPDVRLALAISGAARRFNQLSEARKYLDIAISQDCWIAETLAVERDPAYQEFVAAQAKGNRAAGEQAWRTLASKYPKSNLIRGTRASSDVIGTLVDAIPAPDETPQGESEVLNSPGPMSDESWRDDGGKPSASMGNSERDDSDDKLALAALAGMDPDAKYKLAREYQLRATELEQNAMSQDYLRKVGLTLREVLSDAIANYQAARQIYLGLLASGRKENREVIELASTECNKGMYWCRKRLPIW